MQAVYDLYTKGADALVLELGLASKVHDLIGKKDDWNRMSELISYASIKRGFE
jgi:hypothetical protein